MYVLAFSRTPCLHFMHRFDFLKLAQQFNALNSNQRKEKEKKKRKKYSVYNFFLICYLVAPQPTSGHYQEGSLTHHVNGCVLSMFDPKVIGTRATLGNISKIKEWIFPNF